MQFILQTLVILAIIWSNFAVSSSFFMNEEESRVIKNFVENKQLEEVKSIDESALKISGICYVSEEDWIVWINGVGYSTIGQHGNFSIDAVCEDSVTISFQNGITSVLNVSTDSSVTSEDKKESKDIKKCE